MHLKPKSKSIRWEDSWSSSHLQRANPCGTGAHPPASGSYRPCWGRPLPDFSSARLYDNTASTSQSSRPEEAIEVSRHQVPHPKYTITPCLRLVDSSLGFYIFLPALLSPANRSLFLWCIYQSLLSQLARTFCFHRLTLLLNTAKVPAVAQVPTAALISPHKRPQDTGAPRPTLRLHSHKPS